uniref:Roadblock/LC7 domain-containing protein n=1 Tax=Streptomyces sp. NBC_00093 TaxID=2975649 RepID=A0AAU2ACY9_9ACTN
MTLDTPQPHDATDASSNPADVRQKLADQLRGFVEKVPGVRHALLISRDALPLVDSGIHRDYAHKWAATLGSLASLSENIPGPEGHKSPLQQVLIERADGIILVCIAGTSAAFPNQPGTKQGKVDTVLGVIAEPQASVGTIGWEMGQLVDRFAEYMVEPARTA